MVGGLTSDLFIQLTTTLAHLSNITNNQVKEFGGEVSNETLQGKREENVYLYQPIFINAIIIILL